MATPAAQTRAAHVHDLLRQDIFRGTLPPGHRLRLVELAARFSVSQSVIREALTRLAGQGLVVASPQQGFHVVTLSLDGLNELTEARCEIESLTFRRAVERGDLHWESEIVAAHHLLSVTPESTDDEPNEAWFEVHELFHRALLAGCGNGRLLQ